MARVELAAWEEGTEIVRVYLAASLAEATAVERVLDVAGLDYAVEVEELAATTLFAGDAPRRGAGFWLRAEALDAGADALERAGLVKGLVDRGGG